MKNKYYIDQEVFYKPNYKPGRVVIIDKIGSKWAYFDYGKRFDMKTGVIDGGKYTSPGLIYLNKEEYDNYMLLKEQRVIVWSRVESLYRKLTSEQINKIHSILDEVDLGKTKK